MIKKRAKNEKKDIARHYRNEYRAMLEKRQAGETGYLEFTAYD